MKKVIKVSLKEMIEEHDNLLNVLTNPTRQKLEREARKQKKELKDYLRMKK